jgi:hypothetical protein
MQHRLRLSARNVAATILAGVALLQIDVVGAQAQADAASPLVRSDTGRVWLRLGSGRSDNLERVPTAPESGSFNAAGVQSDLNYQSERLQIDFVADVESRHYSTDLIDDETYGYGTLDLELAAVPDRFFWLVFDEYSQGRVNPLEVSTPENRVGANEFQTGPRLDLPLGSRTLLRLEALAGNRSVEEAGRLDSDTEEATVSVMRSLDVTTEVGLNFVSQGVEYESPATEIDTAIAYLSYRKTLRTGEAYLALGSTRSERDTESSTTPYLDLSWARDIGARSRLDINAVQQYADFFDDPRFGGGSDPLLVRDVFEQQMISIRYSLAGVRNALSLARAVSRADYSVVTSLDYEETSSTVEFKRSMTPKTDLTIRYSAFDRDYEAAAGKDETLSWYLSLDRDLGRRFSLEAIYESRDDWAILSDRVEENILRIYLRYALTNAALRPAQ